MTTTQSATARIQAARKAMIDAQAVFEQTVRDAVNTEEISPSDVARALGTKNRQRVYAILGRGEDEPSQPSLRPVVYLRGAGRPDQVWERVRAVMWARGWVTISDRTAAWHLARGGAPVVMVDFSTHLDDTEPAPDGGTFFGYNHYVIVGRVRARYGDDHVMELPRINGGEHSMRDRVDEHQLALWVAQALD